MLSTNFENMKNGARAIIINRKKLGSSLRCEPRWDRVRQLSEDFLNEPGKNPTQMLTEIYAHQTSVRKYKEEIYAMLTEITKKLKLEGYAPQTTNVLADVVEEEKENTLSYYNEKIAIAFLLLKTAPGTPIRIVKNLRVCADCHLAIKLTSKVFEREIIVRDRSRFHHFRDGSCSCRDYW
ncbi:hypothetical protein PTKIN_Ptkin10aG0197500 [Pterospermum kingtungense]